MPHKETNLWKFGLRRPTFGLRSCKVATWKLQENNERKTHCCTICFLLSDAQERLQTRSLIIWVRNYLFLKTTAVLQREPFLTMFYTIKNSPLLVTKYSAMLTIILSNNILCPVPLMPYDTTNNSANIWFTSAGVPSWTCHQGISQSISGRGSRTWSGKRRSELESLSTIKTIRS